MATITKTCLLLLLIGFSIKAKSQNYLNADYKQIKESIKHKGGYIRIDKLENGITDPEQRHILYYGYPESIFNKTDIYLISFYLDKDDKCYKYFVQYKSDRFLKKITDSLDNPHSDLQRTETGLVWIDQNKKYKIRVLNAKLSNGDKTTIFGLEFRREKTY